MPGLACFDLDTFLNMTRRSHKWQCPHSMRNMVITDLQVDTYVSRLLAFLKVRPLACPAPPHMMSLLRQDTVNRQSGRCCF